MRQIVVRLIDSKRVIIRPEYIFEDIIFNRLNDNNDFIQIDNNMFAKSAINHIYIEDVEDVEEEVEKDVITSEQA